MAHDILIVDDEADIRALMSGILRDEGYETREAGNSAEALAVIRARRPTLVVLDIWLQGSEIDGLEILKIVKRETPTVPVVMISGHGNIETAVASIKMGAYDFIEKPFKSDRLLLVVERAIEASRLRRENEELKQRAGSDDDLIGVSQAISQLRQQIDRVAPTNSRVLITGGPGSGKEVVARLLHGRSKRVQGPFVTLSCATMRPERLEIELFGAEAGVEGPDSPRKVGFFEEAHGGTLFLDEVACRSRLSSASAEAGSRSTSACWPRPIATCRTRSPPGASARISITDWRWCRCTCRRCIRGRKTCRC
jgi:two-component system nitrogen regulation response regulator NtrX